MYSASRLVEQRLNNASVRFDFVRQLRFAVNLRDLRVIDFRRDISYRKKEALY